VLAAMAWNPRAGVRELDVLEVLPRVEVRRGVDRAVVAEGEQSDRMDLEMQVVRRPLRIAGVPDESEHGARMNACAVHRRGRVCGEVRVVELISLAVDEPETPAADPVPADGEDEPVRDREDRRAEWREDVVAVMPADV